MTRAALIAVCLSAAGCGVDKSELFLSAAPGQIQATGQATTVTVDAVGPSGGPGEGSVTLANSAGVLKETTLPLSAGSAHTTYSCLSNCGSAATITATWRAGSRTVTAELLVRFVAPGTDAGQSAKDAGGTSSDAGPSADAGHVTPPAADAGADAGMAPFVAGDAVLIGLVDGPNHFGVQTLGTASVALGFSGAPDQLALTARGLTYRRGAAVFLFVADPLELGVDGGWQSPAMPEANDLPVESECAVDAGVVRYVPGSGDELWFVCTDGSLRRNPGGNTYPLLPSDVFISGSAGVALLARDGGLVLQSAAGNVTPLAWGLGLTLGSTSTRADLTGFEFAYPVDGGCRVGRSSLAGAFTDLGPLASVPTTYEQAPGICLASHLESHARDAGVTALLPAKSAADQTWLLLRRGPVGTTPILQLSTQPSSFGDPIDLHLQSAAGFGVVIRQ